MKEGITGPVELRHKHRQGLTKELTKMLSMKLSMYLKILQNQVMSKLISLSVL
jgi:hypothetical protein